MCAVSQSTLLETKKSLDEYKAILRERTRELQKYEQQRKQLEKQKTNCSIEIKEVTHNIDRVQKDGRDAVHKVCIKNITYQNLFRVNIKLLGVCYCYLLGEGKDYLDYLRVTLTAFPTIIHEQIAIFTVLVTVILDSDTWPRLFLKQWGSTLCVQQHCMFINQHALGKELFAWLQ